MDISTGVSLTGIFVSLTVFCFVLRHAVMTRKQARGGGRVERVRGNSNSAASIRLIAISQDRGCRERLKDLAEFYGWDLFLCSNCESAAAMPGLASIPVVLCDRDQLDMSWRDAFRVLLAPDRSRCMILCSQSDDDLLWQEVIRLGGYDIVRKPLCEEQIVRTIEFAWVFCKTVHAGTLPFHRIPVSSHFAG
jgi:DNA-binding NtrC family response regulator